MILATWLKVHLKKYFDEKKAEHNRLTLSELLTNKVQAVGGGGGVKGVRKRGRGAGEKGSSIKKIALHTINLFILSSFNKSHNSRLAKL